MCVQYSRGLCKGPNFSALTGEIRRVPEQCRIVYVPRFNAYCATSGRYLFATVTFHTCIFCTHIFVPPFPRGLRVATPPPPLSTKTLTPRWRTFLKFSLRLVRMSRLWNVLTFVIGLQVPCEGSGSLEVNYCFSWSVKEKEVCDEGSDITQGSPSPKCGCNERFTIPEIRVCDVSPPVARHVFRFFVLTDRDCKTPVRA